MSVYLPMLLAALIWSLYPLAATLGLQTMSSIQMIMVVYFFSGFGALIMGFLYLWYKKAIGRAIKIQKTLHLNDYLTILISGTAGVLCHTFFIVSLTMADKGGVSLLYESWPIIAVVATPFLIKKQWKEVSLKEFVISFIALIGVAIIIFSDKEINIGFNKTTLLTDSIDYQALGGYILAFAGGYMCAVLVVTKGVYAEKFSALGDSFGATMISEIFSRSISLIWMLIGFYFLKEQMDFETVNWASTFYIGFIVFVVGGALYTYGLLKSETPTIHIVYYLVPVLAVVWLWLARETEINAGLFIGGFIVLSCNAYLFHAGRKAEFSSAL